MVSMELFKAYKVRIATIWFYFDVNYIYITTQQTFTCSKSTKETLGKCVKCVQS